MGKFQLFINDDEDATWESGVEAADVDQISVVNARGEVTSIGSHGGDTWLRIRFSERAQVATYLDQIERQKLEERREMYEQPAENMDDYVEANPDTGVPMERTPAQESQESQEGVEEQGAEQENTNTGSEPQETPEEALAEF